tara:strand:+ start:339 stop:983 length:645 start_codon:yes stop_codon:yes gene_type:complete
VNKNHQSIIVCGTDTDIGKTIISSLLVQGLNASYWKPIQSGLIDGSDTNRISEILELPSQQIIPELYRFKAPVSPHWAAEKERRWIDPNSLKLPFVKGPLIIETAGGLMVPLNRDFLQIDLIKKWGLPIVLVAKSGLGTLNHTLLSLEALNRRNIPVLGIILNGEIHKDNPNTLEQFGDIPIIAQLPILKEISKKTLAEQWCKQNLAITFQNYL